VKLLAYLSTRLKQRTIVTNTIKSFFKGDC